jgi:DnaJ-class molecular chaperone
MFAKIYVRSALSSDLRDDAHHHSTDALAASALADQRGGAVLGSLLCRVKYADGTTAKEFHAGSSNLTSLLKEWTTEVKERGRSRGWVKIRGEWDITAAEGLYAQVARESLAYWMDPHCVQCHGSKVGEDRRACPCCKGTGSAPISGKAFVAERVADMVSELEGIFQAHSGRASSMMRRQA